MHVQIICCAEADRMRRCRIHSMEITSSGYEQMVLLCDRKTLALHFRRVFVVHTFDSVNFLFFCELQTQFHRIKLTGMSNDNNPPSLMHQIDYFECIWIGDRDITTSLFAYQFFQKWSERLVCISGIGKSSHDMRFKNGCTFSGQENTVFCFKQRIQFFYFFCHGKLGFSAFAGSFLNKRQQKFRICGCITQDMYGASGIRIFCRTFYSGNNLKFCLLGGCL